MGADFSVIDHTADVGITAYGRDLKELFTNAARGMFSLIIDPDVVEPAVRKSIEVSAPDHESLLVGWLNELLYLLDTDHLVFTMFEVVKLTGRDLRAKCYGEKLDLQKHRLKREVKAATYHNLAISKSENMYSARIIFDI